MDMRRPPRTVSDPKVRQVGFVTPSVAPPTRSLSDAPTTVAAAAAALSASSPPSGEISLPGSSLSPVMIPPPRHASSDGRPSAPVAVPNPASSLRRDSLRIRVGSYNASEVVLGTPPSASPSSRTDYTASEFSEEAMSPWHGRSGTAKVASSFPGSSSEMIVMKTGVVGGGGAGSTPKSPLTTASVVKTLPGISGVTLMLTHCHLAEKEREVLMGTQNDGAGASKTLKEKTTKAERRALQEAQRAAKAAAKEAGAGVKPSAASGSAVAANTKQGKVVKPPPQKKDGPQIAPPSGTSEKKVVDRPPEKDRKKDVPAPRMQFDDKHRVEKAKRRAVVNQFEAKNRVELFRHLPQYIHGTQLPDLEGKFFQLDPMHPSVYKVAFIYSSFLA
ncbi:hypothetical protein BHE74_00057073 [Ensete ventricosum]|nr:hypothetical protein GW17_00027836 [Ensete ventricosum]RWW37770.1 hypothetical protein BHE74_00057073 [Ensete ventricosum]